MSGKLTQKQENFALKYIECGNASEAYRHAYNAEKSKPESIHVRASELLSNSNVAVRVEELRQANVEANAVTLEYLTNELRKCIGNSDAADDRSNHRGATMDLAKLHGMLIERHQEIKPRMDKNRGKVARRFAERFKKDGDK